VEEKATGLDVNAIRIVRRRRHNRDGTSTDITYFSQRGL